MACWYAVSMLKEKQIRRGQRVYASLFGDYHSCLAFMVGLKGVDHSSEEFRHALGGSFANQYSKFWHAGKTYKVRNCTEFQVF